MLGDGLFLISDFMRLKRNSILSHFSLFSHTLPYSLLYSCNPSLKSINLSYNHLNSFEHGNQHISKKSNSSHSFLRFLRDD